MRTPDDFFDESKDPFRKGLNYFGYGWTREEWETNLDGPQTASEKAAANEHALELVLACCSQLGGGGGSPGGGRKKR